MNWNTLYLPPDKTQWKGRADAPPASSFFQIIQMLNLTDHPEIRLKQNAFALIGFRSEAGIRRNMGRVGAAEGPKAIRHALSKLPVQRQNFVCFDAGDIMCTEDNLEEAQHAFGEVIALLLQQNITPIALGGGHEIAWGHYQGINDIFPDKHLGIINFDAHFDMRPLLPDHKGSSGTPFLQIAEAHRKAKRRFDYNCIGIQHAGNTRQLLETAKSYNAKVIWADELHHGQLEKCVDFVDRVADENEIVYASLCLDVFAAAFAPGVSAIQPLGLLPWHVIPLVRQLAASGRVISYDIAELSPRYDIDQCTAKLAANLIYEITHHHNHYRPRL
ncbi:MAG TPA: formimidoylglutamase [Gammaproteobacteria bacterium]|nr:formimidoylglutamase [Gammaproteobacteria bacterium]